MEDITDAKEFEKILKLKNSGEYHDLYVQSNMLLLTFESIC